MLYMNTNTVQITLKTNYTPGSHLPGLTQQNQYNGSPATILTEWICKHQPSPFTD